MTLDTKPKAIYTVEGARVPTKAFTSRKEARSHRQHLVAAGFTDVSMMKYEVVSTGVSTH